MRLRRKFRGLIYLVLLVLLLWEPLIIQIVTPLTMAKNAIIKGSLIISII